MNPDIIGCKCRGVFMPCILCGYDNQSLECRDTVEEQDGEYK